MIMRKIPPRIFYSFFAATHLRQLDYLPKSEHNCLGFRLLKIKFYVEVNINFVLTQIITFLPARLIQLN
jgi:hypothetical protein